MNTTTLISELTFKAVRSSGAGGQNVNKVASKVELYFDLNNSAALDEAQKDLLFQTLKTKLTKEHILILQCEESRSQHKNKAIVIERFLELIKSGLIKPKKRKATKIPKSAIKKRLKAKRDQSDKKAFRKPPPVD